MGYYKKDGPQSVIPGSLYNCPAADTDHENLHPKEKL
jgi:hypothetical protein